MQSSFDIFSRIAVEIESKREQFLTGDGRELAEPPHKQEARERRKEKRSVIYPLCLHNAGGRAPFLILAYYIKHHTEYLAETNPEQDVKALTMQAVKSFKLESVDAYYRLLEDAEQVITDYQAATGEQPRAYARVNLEILRDVLAADTSVFHFLVYGAIKSILDYHQTPWSISTAMIERRILGFTSKKSFDEGYAKLYTIPVRFTRDKIRRATLQLVKAGYFQRATVGKFTWYSTAAYSRKHGIRCLHQHALNVALRNKRKAEQLRQAQESVNQIYRQEVARMNSRQQPRQEVVEQKVSPPPGLPPLPVKLYRREEIQDGVPIRHQVTKPDGETVFAIQVIKPDTLQQYTQQGWRIDSYQMKA